MFCMLLRKYLAGGKILALRQPPMERLAELVVEAANEMGDKVRRRLVLEAMGRRTNSCCGRGGPGLWTACAGWRGT